MVHLLRHTDRTYIIRSSSLGPKINGSGQGGGNMETEFAFRAESVADTVRFAEALGVLLEPGSVIAMDGDLGAGKTRFSQALAKTLQIPGIVNSPTFTI